LEFRQEERIGHDGDDGFGGVEETDDVDLMCIRAFDMGSGR